MVLAQITSFGSKKITDTACTTSDCGQWSPWSLANTAGNKCHKLDPRLPKCESSGSRREESGSTGGSFGFSSSGGGSCRASAASAASAGADDAGLEGGGEAKDVVIRNLF